MTKRNTGGSSPTKEAKYKSNYTRRAARTKKRLTKLMEELQTAYPKREYKIVSHERSGKRGSSTKYKIVRTDNKEKE